MRQVRRKACHGEVPPLPIRPRRAQGRMGELWIQGSQKNGSKWWRLRPA
eukprot:symbB.v1.2.012211.t1/scaffold833.1/size175488/1